MREGILLLALLATGQAVQEPSLRWNEFHEPVYPQMARIAHIEGRVVLGITVQPDGTVTVDEAEGHPILVQAAKGSVQESKPGCDGCGNEPHTFSVTYEFKITDPPRPSIAVQPVRPAIRHYRIRSIRCMYLWRCSVSYRP
jgi:TonB family protein